ncbi:hypothetical protein G5C60_34395 [Streptomyces sp. HC44]|uniref:Uncharacterized protein n=1 Tax=Streptomyces scabichelini TaxID=2711217 RepID=A0A6G4VEQ4_9ACTN|nr:hypothetical protein [Streptomyces scabichelini]NGO12566.1 hypothetical protein [Streptomyces scabichelini]
MAATGVRPGRPSDDWTQKGRGLMDYHPDMPYAESSARLDRERQASFLRIGSRLHRPR